MSFKKLASASEKKPLIIIITSFIPSWVIIPWMAGSLNSVYQDFHREIKSGRNLAQQKKENASLSAWGHGTECYFFLL